MRVTRLQAASSGEAALITQYFPLDSVAQSHEHRLSATSMTKTGRRTAALPMRGRNCPPRFHGRTRHLQRKKGDASATIFGLVSETRLAKRYFVSRSEERR